MKIQYLQPFPDHQENFRRDRERFIPKMPGCYVLATFQNDVLYVGLTKNLRRRFEDHLNDPEKISRTENGTAFFFYWLECDDLEKVERTWQNECELEDGVLPILNSLRSPVSV